MRNSSWHYRLKRLEEREQIRLKAPVFVETVDGRTIAYFYDRGQEQQPVDLDNLDPNRPVFIDDI